jgi:hypothetical protein
MVESLECRMAPSGAWPINTIGTSTGSVTQRGALGSASVTVQPGNLTPQKHTTLFGVFVQPSPSSNLMPRIVAVVEGNGQKVPLQPGRPFVAGRTTEAAIFAKVDQPGPLTVIVAGLNHTTGSFTIAVTLAGDVNGDGTVNLADLQAFAPAYSSATGQPNYNAAADFNLNGLVNLYDAKALEHNMTPLSPDQPLDAVVNLQPSDQAQYAASKNSGGSTFKKAVTIVGHTTPGSLVITDSTAGFYSFDGPAVPTDAKGYFFIHVKNSSGVSQNELMILDPFGKNLIRSFPVFWIPFAAPGSKLK